MECPACEAVSYTRAEHLSRCSKITSITASNEDIIQLAVKARINQQRMAVQELEKLENLKS